MPFATTIHAEVAVSSQSHDGPCKIPAASNKMGNIALKNRVCMASLFPFLFSSNEVENVGEGRIAFSPGGAVGLKIANIREARKQTGKTFELTNIRGAFLSRGAKSYSRVMHELYLISSRLARE